MENTTRRVVVTGLGVISPVGNTVEACWNSLKSGVHGIGPITLFDTTDYKTKIAAEVKDFDPRAYMDKTEVLRSDAFSQYGVAAACQAVEESGVIGTLPPERVAVYFGSGIGGIRTFTEEHNKLLARGPKRVSPYFIPMLIANMAAGMIAIRFNCRGAAMPSVTACASGTNAIGEAMRAIRHGYADAVITGGSEAAITECGVAGFINMQALSVSDNIDAASLPFDRRRAGFVLREGAAVVVLENYDHAVARGAHIYAEMCGYGNTCDAHHITAPDPQGLGAMRAMRQALAEGGFTVGDLGHLNAHGTSTHANDSMESAALYALAGEAARDIPVVSVKGCTGHMLGGAGAVEAIVCALSVVNQVVPPTVGFSEADPESPVRVSSQPVFDYPQKVALSNSLGFGGHNASLALSPFAE